MPEKVSALPGADGSRGGRIVGNPTKNTISGTVARRNRVGSDHPGDQERRVALVVPTCSTRCRRFKKEQADRNTQ